MRFLRYLVVACSTLVVLGCEKKESSLEDCVEALVVVGAATGATTNDPAFIEQTTDAVHFYARAAAAETGHTPAAIVQAAARRAERAIDTDEQFDVMIKRGRRCMVDYINAQ